MMAHFARYFRIQPSEFKRLTYGERRDLEALMEAWTKPSGQT